MSECVFALGDQGLNPSSDNKHNVIFSHLPKPLMDRVTKYLVESSTYQMSRCVQAGMGITLIKKREFLVIGDFSQ